MSLPAAIAVTAAEIDAERDPSADEDVHFTEHLAGRVIEAVTEPGDLVFDPFAGFGTTLAAAQRLGRRGVGVELLPERVAATAARAPDAVIVEGDSRGLGTLLSSGELPLAPGSVALVLTSPPWMTINDHPENPLTAYELNDGDYFSYLDQLSLLGRQVGTLLAPQGRVVINVADLWHEGVLTPLIADARTAISRTLRYERTIAVEWDHLPTDVVAEALLVFQNRPGSS